MQNKSNIRDLPSLADPRRDELPVTAASIRAEADRLLAPPPISDQALDCLERNLRCGDPVSEINAANAILMFLCHNHSRDAMGGSDFLEMDEFED